VANPNNTLENKDTWFGSDDEELSGFSWKKGKDCDTNGVIFWNDLFLYDTANGDKLAILLIDTQGLFDSNTSPADNSRIFALGTLISSVQIFNLAQNIQEDQLNYLQLATNFAQILRQRDETLSEDEKPFQNFIFLMRDWSSKKDYDYGLKGGNEYLESILKITRHHGKQAQELRNEIRSSFERLNCFLMPHVSKFF
jgi:atlastin